MAKKAIKKSSSSRRVTPRPLGFWQFIRKNLLIISGLLLLPVTVGAVVSSYNYANQSSAASLRTQNVFKSTTNLRTQGSSMNEPCNSANDTEQVKSCTKVGGSYQCRTCTANGCSRTPPGGGTAVAFDCWREGACANQSILQCGSSPVCTQNNYQIVECPKIDSGGTWTSNGKCKSCQANGQWNSTVVACNAAGIDTNYVSRQCGVQVLPKDKVCAANEESLQDCGGNPDGSDIKCFKCNATKTDWDRDQACNPNNIPNYRDRCFPKKPDPVDSGRGGAPQGDQQRTGWEYGNDCYKGGSCESRHNDACKDKGGWARDKDNDLPTDCSSRGGIPCPGGFCKGGVGVNSAFDVKKAIKNFFGIFGF